MTRRIDPRLLAIISTLAGAIPVLLGYAYGGELWPQHWWVIVFGIFLIANLLREWWAIGQVSVEPLEELKVALVEACAESISELIKSMGFAALNPVTRVYTMNYDQKAERLFIETYSSKMKGFQDEIKRFRPAQGQGIQGMAFSAKREQFQRYDPTALPTDPSSWGLMELRMLIPKNIKWCWAFPLDGESPFGVLYADTTADLTREQGDRIASILQSYANILSYIELAI
jgi:hypothetical protein